jgi:hypothetical protein
LVPAPVPTMPLPPAPSPARAPPTTSSQGGQLEVRNTSNRYRYRCLH